MSILIDSFLHSQSTPLLRESKEDEDRDLEDKTVATTQSAAVVLTSSLESWRRDLNRKTIEEIQEQAKF
ncbi:hypothetical protein Bca4012_060321 [Brassica carinata]